MIAVCHTPGCVNEDEPVDVGEPAERDADAVTPDLVVCGPCGQPITDLT